MELVQYSIVIVNLDPTLGSEIRKTRPCVILSPDEINRNLQTIVVAPITSKSKHYPTRLEIRHKEIFGWVVLDQIRTIDKQRIISVLDRLSDKNVSGIKSILRETYVD